MRLANLVATGGLSRNIGNPFRHSEHTRYPREPLTFFPPLFFWIDGQGRVCHKEGGIYINICHIQTALFVQRRVVVTHRPTI